MRLYLVRHGQTAWNTASLAQGHTDIPLDETGLEQAESVAQALSDVRFGRILCSDLGRAVQTAEPLSRISRVPIEKTSLLRERKFGEWEGLLFEEITARYIELKAVLNIDRNDVRAPGGGESFHDVWDRLDTIVAELFDSQQSVVLVTHGGTSGVLLSKLLQANLATHRSFRFSNGSITELYLRGEGAFQLVRYNDLTHWDAYLRAKQLAGQGPDQDAGQSAASA